MAKCRLLRGNVFYRILIGGPAYITKKCSAIKQTWEMLYFRYSSIMQDFSEHLAFYYALWHSKRGTGSTFLKLTYFLSFEVGYAHIPTLENASLRSTVLYWYWIRKKTKVVPLFYLGLRYYLVICLSRGYFSQKLPSNWEVGHDRSHSWGF